MKDIDHFIPKAFIYAASQILVKGKASKKGNGKGAIK